jgi:hypothetical protein
MTDLEIFNYFLKRLQKASKIPKKYLKDYKNEIRKQKIINIFFK